MVTLDIANVVNSLAATRPVFHSEDDFKFALAWRIHELLPEAAVRLEMPVPVGRDRLHIDILVIHTNASLGLELKYKTRGLNVVFGGERFALADHAGQPLYRYDFLKDVQRLESLALRQGAFVGYAVFLTNDSAYWTTPRARAGVSSGFSLEHERVLSGKLSWGRTASSGTKSGRERPISLRGRYCALWHPYSRPTGGAYGDFRFLCFKVRHGAHAV